MIFLETLAGLQKKSQPHYTRVLVRWALTVMSQARTDSSVDEEYSA
jgi:hypothetical protein